MGKTYSKAPISSDTFSESALIWKRDCLYFSQSSAVLHLLWRDDDTSDYSDDSDDADDGDDISERSQHPDPPPPVCGQSWPRPQVGTKLLSNKKLMIFLEDLSATDSFHVATLSHKSGKIECHHEWWWWWSWYSSGGRGPTCVMTWTPTLRWLPSPSITRSTPADTSTTGTVICCRKLGRNANHFE